MQIRPGVELASLSDVGCQRENNEDWYAYWEPAAEDEFRLKGRLVLVADGMGGYEGGQEASRLAVEVIQQTYAQHNSDPRSALLAGFELAHRRIQQEADQHSELHGMGTTCTAAAIVGQQLFYAHVGDSRLYRAHDGALSQVTRDHSYVGRLVEHGVISAEEAESHPRRHVLTAALGSGDGIEPDQGAGPITLANGDVLVLCTDGLWGLVHEDEILSVVAKRTPLEACRELIQTAKVRGGPDNITVQVVRLTGE